MLGIGTGLLLLFIVLVPRLPRILSSTLGSTVFRTPPPFAIELVSEGRTITERSLMGKITVLNFWAHWCGPCRRSLPHINAVAQHYAGDPSVAVVAVAIDWSDGSEPIETFLREGDMSSVPVGKPASSPDQPVILEAFGGTGIPFFVIIDKTGTIRYEHRGFLAVEDIKATIIEKIEELRRG